MKLKLLRPVVFFDLETTSKNVSDARIVQIALIRIDVDGTRTTYNQYVNPGIPIPPDSSAIHGITDEMVADAPSFDVIVFAIFDMIDNCDLAGYNSNKFDVPILAKQMEEQGILLDLALINLLDILVIFTRKEDRKLGTAYNFYTGKVLENAHDALADIDATIEIFLNQLERYEDLPTTMEELAYFSNYDKPKSIDREGWFITDENDEVRFAKGKNTGLLCSSAIGYLIWMETKSDLSEHVKLIAKTVRERCATNARPFQRKLL